MNWIKETENELRTLRQRQKAIENIQSTLKALEDEFTSLKRSQSDVPVSGGYSRQEDMLINNIAKREKLLRNLDVVSKLVKVVEESLAKLTVEEQEVLTLFYIDRPSRYIDILCEYLNVEVAQVYRKKDEAIKKLAIIMYGLTEL